ncbi:MAG: polyribonucleotide nucleotidyltransferase [Parcubacteria group bacterium]|nr:polyribonucleotide nucleotidyltransferase [Parcubacteria group bacterium]
MADKDYQIDVGGKKLSLRVSDWAEQASGSVLCRMGDTLVMVNAVMASPRANLGFFPLTVEYEEKFYAAGKILGSRYMRREGRPADEAIITARLIDRAIRPLFPGHLSNEIQVVVTCLSWDGENDPDVLGLIGASLALGISNTPWSGPLGVVRVGRKGGKFILNPTYEERRGSDIDFLFSVVRQPAEEDELLVNMIEAAAEEVEEKAFEEVLSFAAPILRGILDLQQTIIRDHGKQKVVLPDPLHDDQIEREVRELLGSRLEQALFQGNKQARMDEVNELKREMAATIEGRYPKTGKSDYAKDFFEKELDRLMRNRILKEGKRVDDRGLNEVRELAAEVSLLPRTHGSALFVRGQTKTLSILTLGTPGDQKLLEGMEFIGKKRFMHHYNFPPYSTGEAKPMRGPGRREIGHGMLAEKALLPVIPEVADFPYTIRIVTEAVSSNGSTSMASACSSSLALMDAGVPIKRPVAGISIGLVADEQRKEHRLLVDIQGPEDHHGDMDFKVAGTTEGITAAQMDVKTKGIPSRVFAEALKAAKEARLKILKDAMAPVLATPRSELSPWAPRIYTLTINKEKIGELIGPGGKTIRRIIEECEVEIDVEDSGEVFVTATKEEAAQKALAWIKNITREVMIGETFTGRVVKTAAFGAFVELFPGQEGMVHISELAPRRVERVEDVTHVGDMIRVKVIKIDDQGKIGLSLKQAQ